MSGFFKLNDISSYQAKQQLAKTCFKLFRYLFLIGLSYIIFSQLTYILSYAFRIQGEVDSPDIVWVPTKITLENLKISAKVLDYFKKTVSTLSIQLLSGLIEVFTCAVPAYGFARFRFKGKNLLFAIVLIMIILPPQMTAVSMSLNYAHFDFLGVIRLIGNAFGRDIRPNLLDSGFVFWIPSLLGVGYRAGLFIFIYRQFFSELPKELEEAAKIDGANAFETFIRVIIPSSSVAFITVTIFSVIWHWNEYYYSVIFLSDSLPLSVSMMNFATNIRKGAAGLALHVEPYNAAACLLFILPPLLIYLLLQRKFIASIDRVGIVG